MKNEKIIFDDLDKINAFSLLIVLLQKHVAENFNTKITLRDREVIVHSIYENGEENIKLIINFLNQLNSIDYSHVDSKIVLKSFIEFEKGNHNVLLDQNKSFISVAKPKVIFAKTPGQQKYMSMLEKYSLTLCIGPAGTGKTYIAIAKAVNALVNNEVNRIILTRPAIEAGENLGFLPGDLKQKIDPYIRPLFDALHDMFPNDAIDKYTEKELSRLHLLLT